MDVRNHPNLNLNFTNQVGMLNSHLFAKEIHPPGGISRQASSTMAVGELGDLLGRFLFGMAKRSGWKTGKNTEKNGMFIPTSRRFGIKMKQWSVTRQSSHWSNCGVAESRRPRSCHIIHCHEMAISTTKPPCRCCAKVRSLIWQSFYTRPGRKHMIYT